MAYFVFGSGLIPEYFFTEITSVFFSLRIGNTADQSFVAHSVFIIAFRLQPPAATDSVTEFAGSAQSTPHPHVIVRSSANKTGTLAAPTDAPTAIHTKHRHPRTLLLHSIAIKHVRVCHSCGRNCACLLRTTKSARVSARFSRCSTVRLHPLPPLATVWAHRTQTLTPPEPPPPPICPALR